MPPIRCVATEGTHLSGDEYETMNRFVVVHWMERVMREYSDENLGARALNWVVIAGAALLFVLASFSSLTPSKVPVQSQRVSVSVPHATHA